MDGRPRRPRFNTTPAPPPEWIVGDGEDGLIPAHTSGLLVGPGGVGKTRWNTELAVHVAAGREFQGYPVKHGGVLVFIGEQDVVSLKRRYKAIAEGHRFSDTELEDVERNLELFSTHGRHVRFKSRRRFRA